jgi:hypothetical protein
MEMWDAAGQRLRIMALFAVKNIFVFIAPKKSLKFRDWNFLNK